MRSIRIILSTVCLSSTIAASAQSLSEAYNLSNLTVQGTARSMGFGGALGSVGGDFSSISVNPAGLGVYRSSEISFTPSLKLNGSSTDFQGNTTSDNLTHVTVNNFGLVFTNAPRGRRYERRNWKAVSFALGMNRVADFNHTYNYSGNNNTSSATQAMEANANKYGDSTVGTLGNLGYQANLITGAPGSFQSIVPFKGGIQQMNSVQETGGINEYLLALGGNYKEKLLLGISIGIPSMYYMRNSSYSESVLSSNTAANPENFQQFNYTQANTISGAGINVKIGAIYKITDFLRIGAAFHSPTYYSLFDNTDYELQSTAGGATHDISTYNGDVPTNQFNYHFTTPFKGVLSATFILKNLGFITADYEYVNYSTMQYQYPGGYDYSNGMSFQQEATAMNDSIKNNYGAASNFRVGAEIKLTKFFMVRAGFGYYGNPYTSNNNSMQRIDLSGGLGFRGKHFFADFAVLNSMYTVYEPAYNQIDYAYVTSGTPVASPVAKINYTLNNVALTVGVKF